MPAGARSSLRIENHGPDRRPITSGAGPSLRVGTARALIELMTTREDLVLEAPVALVRGDVADRAMPMLTVVPEAGMNCYPSVRKSKRSDIGPRHGSRRLLALLLVVIEPVSRLHDLFLVYLHQAAALFPATGIVGQVGFATSRFD